MSTAAPPSPPRPSSSDANQVTYLAVRDRFLSAVPTSSDGDVKFFMEIGRFVLDRWQAEELTRNSGAPLVESASDHLWSQCTEKHLRDLRTEVGITYEQHIHVARMETISREILSKIDVLQAPARFLSWHISTAYQGFIGAIGLLIFGLLFVWIAPSITKTVRATLDDTLPADTRPNIVM